MNKSFFFLFLILVGFNSYSQTLGFFKEGIIITKKSDTIRALILVDPLVTDRIAYKANNDDFEKKMPTRKIKSISIANQYFETVKAGKTERIMTLAFSGKDSLFYHLSQEISKTISSSRSNFTASNINYNYWVKRNGSFSEITTKNYKEELALLLSGCGLLKDVLESEYLYSDIPAIIKIGNDCL